MKKTLLSAFAALFAVSSIAAIAGGTRMVTNVVDPANENGTAKPIWVDPDYPNGGNITYNFDALDLKTYVATNKSTIVKVRCDSKAILKALGVTTAKVISIGIQEGDFTFTYDFNNCSFWAGRINYLQATDVITDDVAIKMAKDFLAKSEALGYFKTMVGEPIIMYRNNFDAQGIAREGKSYSLTVAFPIRISGKSVYQTYGDPLGLTMEVNNQGVSSANAGILPFGLLKADSYKLSVDDLLAFLKKGGNNPYYPPYVVGVDNAQLKAEVKATSFDKIWVINYKYPPYGGQPSIYLTSGIRIKTDKKLDNGPGTEKRDYNMVVSDYKVANNYY